MNKGYDLLGQTNGLSHLLAALSLWPLSVLQTAVVFLARYLSKCYSYLGYSEGLAVSFLWP